MATAFFLVGPPGAGKTTLLQGLVRVLPVPAEGFLTEEIREAGQRVGFAIRDLAGRRGVLARATDRASRGGPREPAAPPGPRVGRYRVDVAALDAVGVAALERALTGAPLVVIDEIGKMEACSDRFRDVVERALGAPGAVIVGTILQAAHPWIDRVKAHPGVTLVPLTPSTRGPASAQLEARVRGALDAGGRPGRGAVPGGPGPGTRA